MVTIIQSAPGFGEDTYDGEARPASRLVAALSFAHPFGFCLFPFGFSHLGRAWLLGSLILICFARGGQFARDLRGPLMASVGAFFLLAIAELPHLDVPGFWIDVVRMGAACVYFFLCLLAFGGDASLTQLGRGIACTAGVFLAAAIPALLTAFQDRASMGTATLHEQKETLSMTAGFHINPNLPLLLCVLWFAVGYLGSARVWVFVAALTSVGLSWLVGVRATFFGAAFASLLLIALSVAPSGRRWWSSVVPFVLFAPVLLGMVSSQGRLNDAEFFDADAFLSGRLTLWTAAWRSFVSQPWWGSGPDSWQSQLAIHLPSTFDWREQSALALDSGGFHNGLLHLLAERGAVVGLLYVVVMMVVTACAAVVLTAWRRNPTAAADAVPYAFLSLVFIFRSLFEISGFLGYYKGPIDYLCTLLFAITITRGIHLWRKGI